GELQRLAPVNRRQFSGEPHLALQLQLVGRLVAGVEPARLLQPFDRLVIERGSLGLAADRVRPDAEPFEIAFYRVGILAFRTLGVRVVEAQDEAPVALPGEQPVEQRRACIADVDAAGGRRREADGNGHGREVAEAPDADKARAWSDLDTATMSTQASKQ